MRTYSKCQGSEKRFLLFYYYFDFFVSTFSLKTVMSRSWNEIYAQFQRLEYQPHSFLNLSCASKWVNSNRQGQFRYFELNAN